MILKRNFLHILQCVYCEGIKKSYLIKNFAKTQLKMSDNKRVSNGK